MLHRHEGSDEEGLVTDLGEEDHGEREHKGVEGPDKAFGLVGRRCELTRLSTLGDIKMVDAGDGVGERKRLVVSLARESLRLLRYG